MISFSFFSKVAILPQLLTIFSKRSMVDVSKVLDPHLFEVFNFTKNELIHMYLIRVFRMSTEATLRNSFLQLG